MLTTLQDLLFYLLGLIQIDSHLKMQRKFPHWHSQHLELELDDVLATISPAMKLLQLFLFCAKNMSFALHLTQIILLNLFTDLLQSQRLKFGSRLEKEVEIVAPFYKSKSYIIDLSFRCPV